jgi:hypothetical protein
MGIRSDATSITPVDGCHVYVESLDTEGFSMTRRSPAIAPDVEVVAGDDIPPSARAEAKAKIAALGGYTDEPVLRARVRLSRSRDPAVARPVIAQGNLDLNGRLLRVQRV